MVFVTKARLTAKSYNRTILSLILPLYDLHNVHVKAGKQIAVCEKSDIIYVFHLCIGTALHTVFHVARWGKRGELEFLVSLKTGLSGIVAAAALVPVVALQVKRLKESTSFEVRKLAHIVFGIGLGVALIFHTWLTAVVMSLALTVYVPTASTRHSGRPTASSTRLSRA